MQRRRFDFDSKKCFISSSLEIRGVSRTPEIISDGELCSNNQRLLAGNYYCKCLSLRCLQECTCLVDVDENSSSTLSLFEAKFLL